MQSAIQMIEKLVSPASLEELGATRDQNVPLAQLRIVEVQVAFVSSLLLLLLLLLLLSFSNSFS